MRNDSGAEQFVAYDLDRVTQIVRAELRTGGNSDGEVARIYFFVGQTRLFVAEYDGSFCAVSGGICRVTDDLYEVFGEQQRSLPFPPKAARRSRCQAAVGGAFRNCVKIGCIVEYISCVNCKPVYRFAVYVVFFCPMILSVFKPQLAMARNTEPIFRLSPGRSSTITTLLRFMRTVYLLHGGLLIGLRDPVRAFA